MKSLRFEWDKAKDRANKRKHDVSFEEAQTVFLDENALRYFDPDHSLDEDRFLMLGMSWKLRVLVVCHCFQAGDSIIRIISARKANSKESRDYWRQSHERSL
ncbi:MAG TPA: BrnT family toxin [Candidatus Hydrogenedentes bacterium]|nr:BrnT family toxin [Candidatus Hydrogenedentota bacterium]